MKNRVLPLASTALLSVGFNYCTQPEKIGLEDIKFDYKPNILWISTEDISPYLACYGDSTIYTPNLDRLAKEGILFENTFASTGQCAPSRHSIITGMHSTATSGSNMRCGGKNFPDYIKCFPLYIQEAGYYCTNNHKTDYNFLVPDHSSIWNENSKIATWKNRPEGMPFFAVFNRHETHESHILQDKPHTVDPNKVPLPPYYPDVPGVRKDVARNYANILELDSILGDYLAELESESLLDSTIIVFWSDHGGPMPRQKREVLESGTRVPMIIRLPNKQMAGTRVKQVVSLMDLGPTMLSLLGIPIPENMHGKAFMGLQKVPSPKYVYGGLDRRAGTIDMVRYVQSDSFLYIRNYYPELPHYTPYAYRQTKNRMMKSILEMRDNNQLDENQMQWFAKTKPVEELYDVSKDPHSMNNLAVDPEYAASLEELKNAHHAWMLETKDIGLFPEAIQASMEKEYNQTMYEVMRNYSVPLEKIMKNALLWTEGEESIPALIEGLNDSLAVIRYHSAKGLGNIGANASVAKDKLEQLLTDTEPSVRVAAAYALMTMGENKLAISVFEEHLTLAIDDNELGYVVLSLLKRLESYWPLFEEALRRTYEKQKAINPYYYTQELDILIKLIEAQKAGKSSIYFMD